MDPLADCSLGAATTTSDEFSTTGGESDVDKERESASRSSVENPPSEEGASSLKRRQQQQKQQQPPPPPSPLLSSAADSLSPELQQLLATQLQQPELQQLLATQLQQRSDEDRRVREELESRLAEETRLRQVAEVQLREKKAAAAQARPLTRYLPVRAGAGGVGGAAGGGSGGPSDFNLRSHIELAGHQVDLCSDVIVDAVSCRGFLHKLGGSTFKVWNRRWFVLDRAKRSLSYYVDNKSSKDGSKAARGGIYFQSIRETYPDHLQTAVKSPNPKTTFVVKTLERPYFLCAPSPEAMRIWVDVIFTGAEGYEAYIA